MQIKRTLQIAAALLLSAAGGWWMSEPTAHAASKRVFELRTYHANEGKLDDLNARFRNHTLSIFERHGMKNIGYWVPQDEPTSRNTLVYIISHESREQARKNWDAFRVDPEWIKVRDASEVNGKLVASVDSVYLDATDYSPMK